jgi:hypothetical protein
MSRCVKTSEKLNLPKAKVITYTEELILLQKILETRDLNKTSQETQTEYQTVLQVATKYYDTINLILNNTDTAKVIEKSYSDSLKKALKANQEVIDLLSRQVHILWEEYNRKENKGVLMKDYLITQIISIQDKLNKLIDRNDINYKANRDYLMKQLSMSSKLEDVDESGDYSDNAQSVFEKLKAKDDAILANNREHCRSPLNAYSFDMSVKQDDGSMSEEKHYTSCQHAADDVPELNYKSLIKACRRNYVDNNNTEFIYKRKYLIRNLKQGFETKI